MRISVIMLALLVGGCNHLDHSTKWTEIPLNSPSLVIGSQPGDEVIKCKSISGDTVKDCVLTGTLDDAVSVIIKIINEKDASISEQEQELNLMQRLLDARPTIKVAPQPPFERNL